LQKEPAMWHIVAIGYIFVTLMFSIAQPGLARKLIYLTFFTILPTLFMFWAAFIRLRNKKMKREEEENDRTLPE
jgi:hypothetical protein